MNTVTMEYLGLERGNISFGGPGTTPSGASYQGGNNAVARYAEVRPEDVGWMLKTGRWKVLEKKEEVVEAVVEAEAKSEEVPPGQEPESGEVEDPAVDSDESEEPKRGRRRKDASL